MMAEPRQDAWALSALLGGFATVGPGDDRYVSGLALDSRRAGPGDLFLAVAGHGGHGLHHLESALHAGVVAVAWEPPADAPLDPGAAAALASARGRVPLVPVERLAQRAGAIADRFYGKPSRGLWVAGVTGTDGKTSCAQFLVQALHRANEPCGVLGTLGYGTPDALEAATHTTPDAVTLQDWLARLHDRGARRVVMEVSSHALDQGRVNGTRFDVALLTNVGRDHLDYHGDVEAYARAKRRLFEMPGLACAVVNAEDALGRALLASPPAGVRMIGYGLGPRAEVRGVQVETAPDGLALTAVTPWGRGRIATRLIGRFNALNLLAVLAVLLVSGIPFAEAVRRLEGLTTVPGRMERFGGADRPLVVVDYAHTPEALEQVIAALREHCRGRLTCVFGCGGDRDPGKRPLMGRVAERLADRVILTDDNPRGEDGEGIIADIRAGLEHPEAARVCRERGAAIDTAVGEAAAGDVVLVAGKGHEDYQLIGDRRVAFSDRARVAALVERP